MGNENHHPQNILLTGATGYIGGRLLPILSGEGHHVRCLSRRPDELRERLAHESGATGASVVGGDVLDADSLAEAFRDIETAYYLVHSMGSDGNFEQEDRQAARNFAVAAAEAGCRRIVYLGGLGDDRGDLSAHLRSRHEVGDILREGTVPVVEFRASIVIGSGSLSFEMVRALVERLPIMITPRWVSVPAQPIAVQDVLDYLVAALETDSGQHSGKHSGKHHTWEIGGTEVTSYGAIMREYARQRSLTRWMIPVPVLTPWLSSLWLGLVTPLFARVGRKLVGSICHSTVVRDNSALRDFDIQPMGLSEAIAVALRNEDREFAATSWSDSVSSAAASAVTGKVVRYGNRLVDSREIFVNADPDAVFSAVESIGGDNGWYHADTLWQVRGWMDMLVGGVGMRRRRRDASSMRRGDVVDCWRVESCQRPHRVLLRAEMKLPGRAWLEFRVRPEAEGVILQQTATFDPAGLFGLAYWYSIYPLHGYVFHGMLQGIAARARLIAADRRASSDLSDDQWIDRNGGSQDATDTIGSASARASTVSWQNEILREGAL